VSISFPPSDFNDWAETYDTSVTTEEFPFIGYTKVLKRIVHLAKPQEGMTVLDLGTGTGNLALPFARAGCELWCTDFSAPMLEKARAKLPKAHFCLHDLHNLLPDELHGPFECIVSAYVFHHFTLEEKIRILERLRAHLSPGGRIVIGDVSFHDKTARDEMKTGCGEKWEEEFYWLADETLAALGEHGWTATYEQVSRCGGVFLLLP
jgi:putative AdoMet-dependent methyltransferase